MFTFTFDNVFYFDHDPWPECWYAYTHPMKEPFVHGYFFVASCEFARHTEDGRHLETGQIQKIEDLLSNNKNKMELKPFEKHKVMPNYYEKLDLDLDSCKKLIDRMRIGGKWDPKFGTAFDSLSLAEPAYRLNREFVNRLLIESTNVAEDDWLEYFKEDCEDSWTYGGGPTEECPTFDDFFRAELDDLYVPSLPNKRLYKILKLYAIAGIPDLYLARHSKEHYIYYYDFGGAVVPVGLPNQDSSLKPYYIL